MDHNLSHTISLLTRTPATLDALLRDAGRAGCEGRQSEHQRSEESASFTRRRRWGRSSLSNHGFFFNQLLLRHEGCGNGITRGP